MGAEQLYEAYHSSTLALAEFERLRYQRIAHIKSYWRNGSLIAICSQSSREPHE
jgi:hypothetical protein